jgi:hypothetical protein
MCWHGRGLSRFINNFQMNSANAFAFFIFGNLMHGMPLWMQRGVSMASASDASTSVIWLHVMGTVIGLIGTSYLTRKSASRLSIWIKSVRIARGALRPVEAPVPANLPSGARVLT